MANEANQAMEDLLNEVETEVVLACNHVEHAIQPLVTAVRDLREAIIKLQQIHEVLAPVNGYEMALTPLRGTLVPISGVFATVFLNEIQANVELVGARGARDRAREALFHEEENSAGGADAEPGV